MMGQPGQYPGAPMGMQMAPNAMGHGQQQEDDYELVGK